MKKQQKILKYHANYNRKMTIHMRRWIFVVFMFLIISFSSCQSLSSSYNYDIPALPAPPLIQTSVKSYINYYNSLVNKTYVNNVADHIVKVKLGAEASKFIYWYEVQEIGNEDGGSDEGNGMCDVVKVFQNGWKVGQNWQGNEKYILTHPINENILQNDANGVINTQYFLDSIHTISKASFTNYNPNITKKINVSPAQISQEVQQIKVYSLTSSLSLHIVSTKLQSTTLSIDKSAYNIFKYEFDINMEDKKIDNDNDNLQDFDGLNDKLVFRKDYKRTSRSVHQYGGQKQLKEICDINKLEDIKLLDIDGIVLIKCIGQDISTNMNKIVIGQIKVSLDSQNLKKWWIDNINFIQLQLDEGVQIEALKIHKDNGNHNDRIYIMDTKSIYQLTYSNVKLSFKQIKVNISNIFKIKPIQLCLSLKCSSYLLIVEQKSGLIFYNIDRNQIELMQKFDGKISIEDIQLITYTTRNTVQWKQASNSQIGNGILQILILLDSRKQFIVEIFHQYQQQGGKLKHILHINKIYHSYTANTNQPYLYASQSTDEDDIENIQKIKKIILPASSLINNNNLGIITTDNKLIFFQYGIPRTFSPSINMGSQFIKEETYTKIIDLKIIQPTNNSKEATYKNYNTTQMVKYIILDMNNKIGWRGILPIQYRWRRIYPSLEESYGRNHIHKLRYAITLNDYVNILQIDTDSMYNYYYMCNLNNMGVITERHQLLNDVYVNMEGLCLQKNEGNDQNQLRYCAQRQKVTFDINFYTIQQQKDQMKHFIFQLIILILIVIILTIGIICWKKIQDRVKQLSKTKMMRRRRLMQSSNLDKSQVIGQQKQQVVKEQR